MIVTPFAPYDVSRVCMMKATLLWHGSSSKYTRMHARAWT